MSAILKYYSNIGCTTELDHPGAFYDLIMGPVTGLDGDNGDRSDIKIYLKNTGDQIAMNTTVIKENDDANRLQFSDGINAYVDNKLMLGDIAPSTTREVLLKVVVVPGTSEEFCSPRILTKFGTLA